MKKYYEGLINNCCFNEQDAKEVAGIIIKEEKVTDIDNYNFTYNYDMLGARWEEQELVDNFNSDSDRDCTIDEIMKLKGFYRLPSGLILSWRY